MLYSVGRRLNKVGLPFHEQLEEMTERFDAFSTTILEYNPELTEVSAEEDEHLPGGILQ